MALRAHGRHETTHNDDLPAQEVHQIEEAGSTRRVRTGSPRFELREDALEEIFRQFNSLTRAYHTLACMIACRGCDALQNEAKISSW